MTETAGCEKPRTMPSAESRSSRLLYDNSLPFNWRAATKLIRMDTPVGGGRGVMLGGVPPNQANFIQRIGRAGRLDGNAAVFAIADASQDGHDQYYFANPLEMIHGDVEAPAIYLNAAEVLRRQIYAFFFDQKGLVP